MINRLLHEPRQRRSWLIFDVRQEMKIALILSLIPCGLAAQSYIGQLPYDLEEKFGKPFFVREAVFPPNYEIWAFRGKDNGPTVTVYVAPDRKIRAVELETSIPDQPRRPNPQFADRWAPLPKAHVDSFLERMAEGQKWVSLPKESSPFILRRADGKVAVRLERTIDANGRIESAKLVVASRDFSEAMKWIPSSSKPKY